ncbi:tRNA 2-selenouridine(34) synthase MnmH [Aquabacterium humicola]|uniref:tRNA 2-selenouridine(34) synthase MnmH n=1 Tax=Aquabacterium humicola TaxID=3237377 RepID=UPI002542C74B|nr:tRNA 2-selenouridine(34) synthase MnmH [Rubrivivax pictus]
MSLKSVPAPATIGDLQRFDAIIDVRSPAEYAEDHLPGAVNWPVLDDEERRVVGTLYVQDSPLAARKLGAMLVSRNIANHLERWVQDKPREWLPLVYCWRGGQRSGSLALVLDQISFRTARLDGGYKAFRARVRDDLQTLPQRFDFHVLTGRTGSGKTRLLHALAAEGAQVLDLEGLAQHRGSVLGGFADRPQPAQKRFDTLLWQALQQLDPARPVFVESESRKIGTLLVPDALISRMHAAGRCIRVDMPDAARVQLLMADYAELIAEPERLCALLQGLVELRGKETVARWQALARAGDWAALLPQLLHQHYDPLYLRSIDRHYAGYADAQPVALQDAGPATLRAAAGALLTPCASRRCS